MSAARPQNKRTERVKVTREVDGHPLEEWVEMEVGDASWPAPGERRLLGHDLVRVDGPLKVTGRAQYTHDVRLPGMLRAGVLCCPLPSAKVELDLAPALAQAGVVDAIVLEGERTAWLGQPVAAVAAETVEALEDGLRAIRARFTPQPWAVDRAQAFAEGAPEVPGAGRTRDAGERGKRDESEAALARCAATVDAVYTLPVQHHAALETHGVVVDFRGGSEATLYASTQGTFSLQGEAAAELGLEESAIRVIVQHMGGGFGAKFGLGLEGAAACRLARRTRRPVHLMLSRAAEFLMAGNRSGSWQRLRGGAAADGTLVALLAEVERYGGVGRGSHPGHPYIYSVQTPWCAQTSVFTHTDSSRAMRAPGHPQAAFAIESWIDELAFALALDPLEMRKRNLGPEHGRQLDEVARRIGWSAHAHRVGHGAPDARGLARGIGFAVAVWGGGGRPACEVELRARPDGSVTASVGSQDLGTGTRTYLAAIPAEELGLPLARVRAELGDSRLGMANGSGGSTTTASLAPAVKDAAERLRLALAALAGSALGAPADALVFADERVQVRDEASRSLAWRELCALLPAEGLSGHGRWQASLAGSGVHGAQAAEVEVDVHTGRVRVLRMVGVHDCGIALNPLAVRSQIQGGMVQALSYALLEERVLDAEQGWMLNANFEDYKLAGAAEIPRMEAVVDGGDQRQVVIGMSEPAIIPGHAAIANALFNACGARVRELPLTPDKVLAALGRV